MFLHLINAASQKMIIGNDPGYFLWVLGNTLWQKQDFFITSTIGVLGWLDTPLPPIFYYAVFFIFGLFVAKTVRKGKPISLLVPFGLTGVVLATLGAIMYYFYINGTAVAYSVVDSLQGRYLLPILPFVLLLIVEWFAFGLQHKRVAILIAGFLFLVLVGQSIFFRYYDYSRVFDTADVLVPLEKDLQDGKEFPLMTVNSSVSYIYDVQFPGYKIGGFQLAVMVNVLQPVNVPYLFELKDATCTKIIQRGYFDETELHRPHIYSQFFSIKSLRESRICLTITPLYGAKGMVYLPLVMQGDKPIVNFLYIKK